MSKFSTMTLGKIVSNNVFVTITTKVQRLNFPTYFFICSEKSWIGAGVNAGAYYYDGYDMYYDEGAAVAGTVLLLAGSLAMITIDVCAIVDACRVAKVRNMYEQDLRKLNYSLELHPSVDYIRMANGVQPTAGLTIVMRF